MRVAVSRVSLGCDCRSQTMTTMVTASGVDDDKRERSSRGRQRVNAGGCEFCGSRYRVASGEKYSRVSDAGRTRGWERRRERPEVLIATRLSRNLPDTRPPALPTYCLHPPRPSERASDYASYIPRCRPHSCARGTSHVRERVLVAERCRLAFQPADPAVDFACTICFSVSYIQYHLISSCIVKS